MQGFKLKHHCGTVYATGNLEFSNDGNSLLSIVGSRTNLFDLKNQTSRTVTAQGRSNLALVALSPDQQILLQIDVDGFAQLVLLKNDAILSHLNFHETVSVAKFSPNGKFLAVALGCKLKIFETAFYNKKFLGALLPHLSFSSWHSEKITNIEFWREYTITSSCDQTVRLCKLDKEKGYIPISLTGHRKPVLGAFPSEKFLFSVSSDARVFVWEWESASAKFLSIQEADYMRRNGKKPSAHTNSEQLTLRKKHQLQHEGAFTLSSVSMQGGMLVAGFKTGNFALYSISAQEVVAMHTLNMTDFEINAISINVTGDWIAFGSKALGQLLVWEWKSETYVLRQMGHSSSLLSASFSLDGNTLATGGIDGKVKLWEKGLCFATFSEHTNGVVDLAFNKKNSLVSCSKDGTVRAYDITRYRQFRVLTTAENAEFTCLAIDNTGEIVCAGSLNFAVYVWGLQTGILTDVLTAHVSPISALIFLHSGELVTGSWDKSVRIWDIFEGKGNCETFDLSSEVLAVACKVDGKEIATSLANGEISMWRLGDMPENFIIEASRDAAGGRGVLDRYTSKNNPNNKRFNSLAYSPDGAMLLAAGNSKYLCIYDLKHRVLLHKFAFTENRSLSGVLAKLNSKEINEAGVKAEMELDEYNANEDLDTFGVPVGHRPGSRTKINEVKATKVVYSYSGKDFGVVTSEGLLVYSMNHTEKWMPMNLSIHVSKPYVIQKLIEQEYVTAVIGALQLGEEELVRSVVERVPQQEICNVVAQISGKELIGLVNFLGIEVGKSNEIGVLMVWVKEICRNHSKVMRGRTEIRNLLRNIAKKYREIAWMTQDNTYLLQYLSR